MRVSICLQRGCRTKRSAAIRRLPCKISRKQSVSCGSGHGGPEVDMHETFLTPAEIADKLKIDDRTVRRLFLDEPGAIVICFPRKGKRL